MFGTDWVQSIDDTTTIREHVELQSIWSNSARRTVSGSLSDAKARWVIQRFEEAEWARPR